MRAVRTTDMTAEEAYEWACYQGGEIEHLICLVLNPEKDATRIIERILEDGSLRGEHDGYCVPDDYRELRRGVERLGEALERWERPEPAFDLAELPASQLCDNLAIEMEL
jgi:hypothetical protein